MSVKSKLTIGFIFVAAAGYAAYYVNNMIETKSAVEKYNKKIENHYESHKFGKITDDRDGHKYATIRIGNQNWMAENMRLDIPQGSACYENKSENCQADGNLYPWEDAQSACPNGWHLSTDKDWNVLEEFIKEENNGDASIAQKLLLKMFKGTCYSRNASCLHDVEVNLTIDGKEFKTDGSLAYHRAIDWYGFGAVLTGIASYAFGEYKWYSGQTGFWTDKETDSDAAVSRILSMDSKYIQRNSTTSKESLLAVRCVQNNEDEPVNERKRDIKPKNQKESYSQSFYETGKEVIKEVGKSAIKKTIDKGEEKALQWVDEF
ncbi:MAG: hypothetical protein HUK21_11390 [Fibrobacteraceae bacterium]|nr:hypothetical protein [Fibrobacteraceae bacterium]